jgi:hypothetical protein
MGNIEKETIEDKTPENGVMLSEIAPVLYKERDVLEREGGSGNRSRRLGAAGLAILTVLSWGGANANKAEAGGFNFGEIANQSARQVLDRGINDFFQAGQEKRQRDQRMEEEAIRQRQNMQTEEIRRMQNMQSDQVRLIQDQLRQIGQEELNALRDFKDGKISKERLTDLKREYREQKENITRGR